MWHNLHLQLLDVLFPRKSLMGGEGDFITEEELLSLRSAPVIVESAALRKQGLLFLDRIVAAADYDHVPMLRKAVHQLKYKKVRGVGRVLGEMLADVSILHFREKKETDETEESEESEESSAASSVSSVSSEFSVSSSVLCPVPLHWVRKFSRGFNQSEVLAKVVSRRTGWPVRNLLKRRRWTGSQVGRKREERLRGVRDAFMMKTVLSGRPGGSPVRHENIPSRVILVDDLSTTGATLNMCAEALKKSGVHHVEGLVLALG